MPIVRDEHKYSLYINAYIRTLEALPVYEGADQTSYVQKMVYYGVKAIGTHPKLKNYQEAVACFEFISNLKTVMSILTLHEFMNIFPIEKVFDGDKYEMKDYYSTLEAINELELEPHKQIGESILELIMEYMNDDIMNFAVQGMIAMSAMRRFDGHLDLIEEFMASEGHKTPNTFKNDKGQVYYVRHGKPQKIKTSNSDHLRLVKV